MALDNGKIAWKIGSNDLIVPDRKPILYASVVLNTASGTTPVTLITGSPYYYITRLLVSIDPTCTTSGGGIVAVNFTDSAFGLIGSARGYCPASFTAPTMAIASTIVESGTGYYFNSTTVGSTLSVALNQALTAGSYRVAINYGLTNYTA